MSEPHDLEELRRALETHQGFDRLQHRSRTESVRAAFPHSVEYRDLVDGSTCLTYALGLFKNRTYIALAGPLFHYEVFAGKLFMEWLLEQRQLNELSEPASGSLVLYFADNVWQHAGTMVSDYRVISQWGTFPLYEHALFEVPASYGHLVRYFAMPSAEEAIALFMNFAKHRYGLTDEDIAAAIAYT